MLSISKRYSRLSIGPSVIKMASRTLTTLENIRRQSLFTENLPPDNLLPSPEVSKNAPVQVLRRSRVLQDGLFSWVAPEKREEYQFMAASPAAVQDLGLSSDEPEKESFQKIVSGEEYSEKFYPWAQAYAGFQFGTWAGQLGDGRVINLFDAVNPDTGKRYEVQIKGGGLTPFSRFADGKAVLRSSIREFLGSEAVNALGIPTSRALALTNLPKTTARRERTETCAIVTRMAESWIRLGTFDLARRQNRGKNVRVLADFVIDKVYGGEDKLVAPKSLPKDATEEDLAVQNSKYTRLYREVVRRNAEMLAQCQTYGFLNGVLNTDNTSILGLSIDYGPFAFMDSYDTSYTPNHDDGHLRYSYRNIVQSMWWNLVRFGEDIGIYLGAGLHLDKPDLFDEEGYLNADYAESIQSLATKVIEETEYEYKEIYQAKLKAGFQKRFGFKELRDDDNYKVFEPFLRVLENYGLDFNQSFRRLGALELFNKELGVDDITFFYPEKKNQMIFTSLEDSQKEFLAWLQVYKERLADEGSTNDAERKQRMDQVNPKFVLKNWILQEVIDRVQNDNDIDILNYVLMMALQPFKESWGSNVVDEMRFTGEVPSSFRDAVCSCSS